MAEPTTIVPRSHVYRILLSDAFERAKGMPCWNEAFRAALAGRGLMLVEPDLAFFHDPRAFPDGVAMQAPACNVGPGAWPAGTVVAWAPNMWPREEPERVPAWLEPVLDEVNRATTKFPTWPDDAQHAISILGEEFGELTKACLQMTYEPHKVTPEDITSEAIQTAAMALRFVMSLGRYRFARSEQHSQGSAE